MPAAGQLLIDNGNETEWDLNSRNIPEGMVKNINEAAAYILNYTLRIEKNENGIPSVDRKV